ncbi:NRG3 protein, partial [Amia calva]|nr:NRG3 protein [Amia calva]
TESEEIYKRQVLSISCIAIGISLLGTLCVAFYCRNKRRTEKLQAHLKESRSLKSYSVNAAGLMSKSSLRPQCGLQLQNYCKGHGSSPALGGRVRESSFSQSRTAPPSHSRAPPTGKHHRSNSLSHSPDQRSRPAYRTTPRRTPPLPRGRLNPIGGARDSGPAYQHLQEVESSEREAETLRGHRTARTGSDPSQDTFLNMQAVVVGGGKTEVPCSRLDRAVPGSFSQAVAATPPPLRACSIPIIPSVLGHDDTSCMQKASLGGRGSCCSVPLPRSGRAAVHGTRGVHTPPSPGAAVAAGSQQEAVALLLEAAQEQLRVLAHAHRKQEDSSPSPPATCERAYFLSPTGAGGVTQNCPPETQLVNPREPHRDSTQLCQ